MFLIKFVGTWLIVGIMAFTIATMRCWIVTKKYGYDFHIDWNLRCTLNSIIAWPSFVKKAEDAIDKILEYENSKNEDNGP